jgi:hypothetical protein
MHAGNKVCSDIAEQKKCPDKNLCQNRYFRIIIRLITGGFTG